MTLASGHGCRSDHQWRSQRKRNDPTTHSHDYAHRSPTGLAFEPTVVCLRCQSNGAGYAPGMPSLTRIVLSAATAVSIGLAAIVLMQGGWSPNGFVRVLEVIAVVVVIAGALLGGMAVIGTRMAGWVEPESEADFDRVIERSERLARDGTAAEPFESEFMELDPHSDADFEELVREALDELPDLLRNVLDNHNVAVTISDKGRRHGAYGLYKGDGATRDNYPDQIIIFRDTLRRDFGYDPDLLREQVTITVRHELAHHVGFDELGVRDLGL